MIIAIIFICLALLVILLDDVQIFKKIFTAVLFLVVILGILFTLDISPNKVLGFLSKISISKVSPTNILENEDEDEKTVSTNLSSTELSLIEGEMQKTCELVFAKYEFVFIRSNILYAVPVALFDPYYKDYEKKLNNAINAGMTKKEIVDNNIGAVDCEYTDLCKGVLKYSVDFSADTIETSYDNNTSTLYMEIPKECFIIDPKSEKNCRIYRAFDDKDIINIPVIKDILKAYKNIQEWLNKNYAMFNERGKEYDALLTDLENFSNMTIPNSHKPELTKCLAENDIFSKYHIQNVLFNGVYLKKDGVIVKHFSDNDYTKIFGEPFESNSLNDELSQVTYTLYFKDINNNNNIQVYSNTGIKSETEIDAFQRFDDIYNEIQNH